MPRRIDPVDRFIAHVSKPVPAFGIILIRHDRIGGNEPAQLGVIPPRLEIIDPPGDGVLFSLPGEAEARQPRPPKSNTCGSPPLNLGKNKDDPIIL